MVHHPIDPWPRPKGNVLFINEPWLLDPTRLETETRKDVEELRAPEACEDNVRIYLPMDLNAKAILRRLDDVITRFGIATDRNEFDFAQAVDQIIWQLEIYDRVRFLRNMPKDLNQPHGPDGLALAAAIIKRLEEIPDGGAELFPFELIDELRKDPKDYLEATPSNA